MKKVLGLVFSHRKLGNSELLVKEIMNRVPVEKNLELIRMTDLKIEPCRACYRCLNPDTECVIKDDFNFVIKKIREADAVIIGVPVYLLGLHGYYKMFTDRLVGAFNYSGSTKDKPCIIAIPYGSTGWTGYSRAAALVMPGFLQMKIIDCWLVHATQPGESFMNDENIEYTGILAEKLFSGQRFVPGKRECSLCGCDVFRMLPDDGVECAICGAIGVLKPGNIPDFSGSGYNRFSSEKIEEHFNVWLREMKEKFLAIKDDLREIQKNYRDMNWWVKPE